MFNFNMNSPAKDNSHRLSSIDDIGLLCVLIIITAIWLFSLLFSWKARFADEAKLLELETAFHTAPAPAQTPTTAPAPAPIAEDVVETESRHIRRDKERVKAKEARALARIKALVTVEAPITIEALFEREKVVHAQSVLQFRNRVIKNLKIEQDLIKLACLKATIIEICYRRW